MKVTHLVPKDHLKNILLFFALLENGNIFSKKGKNISAGSFLMLAKIISITWCMSQHSHACFLLMTTVSREADSQEKVKGKA